MFGPPIYTKKIKYPEYIYEEYKKTAKYHHAAYAYLLIGIVYLAVFYVTMPSHDFAGILEDLFAENIPGIDNVVSKSDSISYDDIVTFIGVFAGTLFLGLTYFIYNEYRTLVIILAVFYFIRFLIAGVALLGEDAFDSVEYVLPLIGMTFYMLARASWNLRP
tara:strand:+ start:11011 stop:11496 length:486 start_codon:yes stop_codon:yes gene_type:complete